MSKVICYKSDPAELRNDCREMTIDDRRLLTKPLLKFCRKEKIKNHLIVIRDHYLRFIIMLTFDKYVKLDELYFSILGLIHNDKRQTTYIDGYLHTDLQYAYEAEVPHTDKFSVYHGMWNTYFKHLCKRSFRINYSSSPSKIIAKAGAYEVLEKYAEALRDERRQQFFREHGKFEPGSPSFPIFYEENPYDFEEEIVDDIEENYVSPDIIFALGPHAFSFGEYVFDTSKIQDKSEYIDFAERMRRINTSLAKLPKLENLLTWERYIQFNPASRDYDWKLCVEYMKEHGTDYPYKHARAAAYLKAYGSFDAYLTAIKSKYDLISLADKNDMYVVNILIDRAVQEYQVSDLLKRYSINEQAPIFIYFWYARKWDRYVNNRSTYDYEIYYGKWGHFFWRLFDESYANPKYIWERNIYYNEMFVLSELADFIRTKNQPEFCHFEYGTQPIDDMEYEPIRRFNPNSSRIVENYHPGMVTILN